MREVREIEQTVNRRAWARSTGLFAAAAIVTSAALLALGQGLTFFADEWAVIEGRSLDLDSFLRPFNEHWLGTTIVVYRLLFGVVGLGSYVPYLAVLVGLHVVVAAEVFVLVRRAAGPAIGLAAGVLMLVFGSGFENLFWAMQIGFIGAVALGFGAMLALDGTPTRARAAIGAVLLTIAVTMSGLGLVMVAAVGIELVADRARRRFWPVAAIPAAIYVTWFILLGRSGVATTRDPFSLTALSQVPGFVVEGAGAAVGAVSGLGPVLGIVLGALLVVLVAVDAVRERGLPARTTGCLAAIVVLYVLTGLVRAQLAVDAALYSRYTYLAGPLLLVALGPLAGRLRTQWRPEGRRRLVAVAGAAVVVALALTWNVRLLVDGRALFLQRAELTRALVAVALQPSPDGVDPNRTLILVPSPASLRRIVAVHGSPLADGLVAGGVPALSPATLTEADRRLREGAGPVGDLPQ